MPTNSLLDQDCDRQFADWAESITLREVWPDYDLQTPSYSEATKDTVLSAVVTANPSRADEEITFLVKMEDVPNGLSPISRILYNNLEYDVLRLLQPSMAATYLLQGKQTASRPAVIRNGVTYPLPRPLLGLQLQDGWDAEQFKIPLADGETRTGHSRRGVTISLDGQIGMQADDWDLSGDVRMEIVEALREILDVDSDSDKYELLFYRSDGTSVYRRYNGCSTLRFDYYLADRLRFRYSLLVHAEDPAIDASSPPA